MKYKIQKVIITLLFSLPATILSVQAQPKANNDFGEVTICNPRKAIVDILDNDQNLCPNPVIKIVNHSKGLASVSITDDNMLEYNISCSFTKAVTDSVKYSVECGGMLDTATVYITIDQTAFAPKITFKNDFDKTCLKENEVITHTSYIKNNCSIDTLDLALALHFLNEGVVTLHEEAAYTITGTVKGIEHINTLSAQVINFTLFPGAELHVTTKYHITEITSGRYETTTAELMGVSFDYFEKRDDIFVCPDRELTVSSCDPAVPPLDVAIPCSSSYPTYSIPPQTSLGSATIDANGILRYTRPARISSKQIDIIKYQATCGSNSVSGEITFHLLPCMSNPAVSSKDNSLCRQDSCEYDGSDLVLINEVMIAPKKNNGAIYGKMCNASQEVGGEWVELYNPNHCETVDISGYILGNATTDATGTACSQQRGLGAGFVLPQGTRIPPMGFCVLRSKEATPVEPSRLVANGGNTVEIIIDNHLGRLYLNNGGTRFWLQDNGGWLGLYDNSGNPLDAISWGASDVDICQDCSPGSISGFPLSSLDGFAPSRKNKVIDFKIDPVAHAENSVKRIPDGGNWATNTLSAPTAGYCNGTCNARFQNTCNGTATVTVTARGSESYSYLWNDSQAQTTATATGLCEGTYCVTITDNETQLTKIVCVEVKDDARCHQLILNPDPQDVFGSCVETTILVDVLQNDVFFVSPAQPELTITGGPSFAGATASISNDNKILYTFPEGSTDFSDRISYSVSINGMTKSSAVDIVFKRNAPKITALSVNRKRKDVTFDTKGGTEPFVNTLDDDLSTAISGKKFTNVSEGWHTLLVTDKNLCTADTTFEMLPDCPEVVPDKYFSPNGDGIHDGWTIANLNCYEFYTLSIYDRSGKLLKKYENNFIFWDGIYRGKLLPSTDYWFVLDIEDVESSITGHFTLMR